MTCGFRQLAAVAPVSGMVAEQLVVCRNAIKGCAESLHAISLTIVTADAA